MVSSLNIGINISMKKTIRNSYYAYKLIDPTTDEPFYVGKGYSTRMYSHVTEANKPKSEWSNPHKCNKILKLLRQGHKIIYEYVLCESEQDASALENQWITEYSENLTNISLSGQVANPVKKSIDAYDINGKFLARYESVSDATRKLSISDEGIVRRCLKNYDSLQTHKGMVFVYKGEDFSYVNKKTKTVFAEKDGNVLTFDNTTLAAKHFNRSKSCIRQCCKNNWSIDQYKLYYKQ